LRSRNARQQISIVGKRRGLRITVLFCGVVGGYTHSSIREGKIYAVEVLGRMGLNFEAENYALAAI
tara:strand:- start:109 stop:306 length:198 start_codon:yes stop_codon:yes gene_type:complete